MKAQKVIRTISRPIRPIGTWCQQVWDGISGKDYRQLKGLRHELAIAKDNEAQLIQALERAKAQCHALEQALSDRNHALAHSQKELSKYQTELAHSQKELIAAQKQCHQLSQDIEIYILDSDTQIQALKQDLNNQTAALNNCESNLTTINRAYAQAIATPDPEEEITHNLADWKLAFVGGHETTRRAVIQTLQTDYGLNNTPVEIPSHKEVSTSQKQLNQKLTECDLIISIVRYSNHSLTKSLKQLKDKGSLKGTILNTNSRGATGVVREILAFVDQHPDWLSDAVG